MKKIMYVVLGLLFAGLGIFLIPQSFKAETSFVAEVIFSFGALGLFASFWMFVLSRSGK